MMKVGRDSIEEVCRRRHIVWTRLDLEAMFEDDNIQSKCLVSKTLIYEWFGTQRSSKTACQYQVDTTACQYCVNHYIGTFNNCLSSFRTLKLFKLVYYWSTKIFAGLAMTTMTRLARDLLHTTYILVSELAMFCRLQGEPKYPKQT